MEIVPECSLDALRRDGFTVIEGVFSPLEVAQLGESLAGAFENSAKIDASVRRRDGLVYAAYNVIRLCPTVTECWRNERLTHILGTLFDRRFGLVRVLYFDKPPGQSWSLPWHRDQTIAVKNNGLPSKKFRSPTNKFGVPHIEAAHEVLRAMVTARIHLDDVTDENGPLVAEPGSHRFEESNSAGCADPLRRVYAHAGDVLLMRPLVSHSSLCSAPGCELHRRVLHLEFSGLRELPDGFEWHDWIDAVDSIAS